METAPQREKDAILDAIQTGVYGVDQQGACTFINKAGLSMLGYALDEVIGRSMHDLIHHTYPDGTRFPQSACPLLETLRNGCAVQLDNEILWRKDGTLFNAECSSLPVPDPAARTSRVVTFQDTSIKGEARTRLGLQITVSRILAGSADLSDTLTQVLAAIGSALGWQVGACWALDEAKTVLRPAALWSAPDAALGGFLDGLRPLELAPGAGLAGMVWKAGTPRHVLNISADPEFALRESAVGERLRSAFAFPVKAASTIIGVMEFFSRNWHHVDDDFLESLGTLGHQIGQFHQRKRAEEDLRESETLKAAVLETALDCVIAIDRESRIIEWNAAAERTFDYMREEVLGGSMPELIIPEEYRHRHYEGLARYLETGRGRLLGRRIEIDAQRRDGTRFPVELSITGTSIRGEPLFTAYLRDITARKQFEAELAAARDQAQEANHAKSQFIANMSHELRTPLTAVIGYGEMLEEEARDEGMDAMLDDLQKINANARHLLSLINAVLDMSKIEAGKMTLDIETVDIAGIVKQAAATVEALVTKKGNRLRVECDDAVGHMSSDAMKIKQCLINLLSNAAKFTENGTIDLTVGRVAGDSLITFRVTDTGIGMDEAQVRTLFQRFNQADSSTTRRFGGTGLGLSITKAFCKLLGGDIVVDSALGQGTTFEMRLPADADGQRAGRANAEARQLPEVSPGDAANVVLVIDDDPHARALLSRFVVREGFAVRAATDGQSGLELARTLRPRAILLDVMMPHMDGWAVLSALKADPDVADIPVIMESILHQKRIAFSLGATDYLTKPIQWTRLKKILDRYRSVAPPARVLIVDDDGSTREMLRELTEKEGWSVIEAFTQDDVIRRMAEDAPALVLVDLHSTTMNAFELIRQLRKHKEWHDVPVVALTAGVLTPEERERLDGKVQQIINTDEDATDAVLSLLHRIASPRDGHAISDAVQPKEAHGKDIAG